MKCPQCQSNKLSVVDSRNDSEAIRRRRECQSCNFRFTTYERVEPLGLMVVKKDGARQPFQLEKLRTGVLRACVKRPVSADAIDRLIDKVHREVQENYRKEISADDVGARILKELKKLDEIAYVRFASVYREFSDVRQFIDTLYTLEEANKEES